MVFTCKRCGKEFTDYSNERRVHCSKNCEKLFLEENYDAIAQERFWNHVDKSAGDSECWIWTSVKNHKGYGRFKYRKRYMPAAHYAYLITYGETVPEGQEMCHHCDNPSCVNPSHLFIGTHTDNMQDCKRKGRTLTGDKNPMNTHPELRKYGDDNPSRKYPERLARGDKNPRRMYPERYPKGEDVPNAKLKWEDIDEIKRLSKEVGLGKKTIGKMYGVSKTAIKYVLQGKTWASK